MKRANAEIERLATLARPGEGRSWWVTGEAGEDVSCRLVYTSQRSELFAALDVDPRIQSADRRRGQPRAKPTAGGFRVSCFDARILYP